jgi:hypothetical protein
MEKFPSFLSNNSQAFRLCNISLSLSAPLHFARLYCSWHLPSRVFLLASTLPRARAPAFFTCRQGKGFRGSFTEIGLAGAYAEYRFLGLNTRLY